MTEAAALSGRLVGGLHVMALRVYYEDTDAAGIVYYANYLRFAERARTELLRLCGQGHNHLMEGEDGVAFAVRRVSADYCYPARLDDLLEVHTTVREVRGASLRMDQTVRRDGEALVTIDVKLACMRRDGRPARLPAGVAAALDGLLAHGVKQGD